MTFQHKLGKFPERYLYDCVERKLRSCMKLPCQLGSFSLSNYPELQTNSKSRQKSCVAEIRKVIRFHGKQIRFMQTKEHEQKLPVKCTEFAPIPVHQKKNLLLYVYGNLMKTDHAQIKSKHEELIRK